MLNTARRLLGRWRKAKYKSQLKGKVHNRQWLDKLIELNIAVDDVTGNQGDKVYFRRLELELPLHATVFEVLRQYDNLAELVEKSGAILAWNQSSDELIVKVGNESYPVHLAEEVYILHEILIKGDYNLRIRESSLLIDIGANVGFTSIFLASKNPSVSIFAYEPLKQNYQRASNNLKLNAHLNSNIALHHYGLSDADAELEMQSVSNNPGRSSIVIDRSNDPTGDINHELIIVKNAGRVIGELVQQHPDKDVWVKLDCEGSEYDIIESLASNGVIEKIKGFILEWHLLNKDGEELDRLNAVFYKHRFNIHMRSEFDRSALDGMCLAVR